VREEVLINVNAFETRVALLQGGALQEVHLQRSGGYSITGNLYRGKIVRILPGMQAAFVDIGLARPGFLHARDVHFPVHSADPNAERDIRNLLHDGQEILVQAVKDPLAGKGARLSSEVAIASRYVVLMPYAANIGVSQRIEDDEERERLRCSLDTLRAELPDAAGLGWIVRTAADGARHDDLRTDMLFLMRMWGQIDGSVRHASAPALIYEELPLHIRVTRDLASASVEAIKVDDEATYAKVHGFMQQFVPEYLPRLELHVDSVALFDRYGLEDEINRALEPRVPLKSGGYLIIEQTESMTTIDVNTGGYVGSHSLEETVYRTNLEAAAAIPRQLRLRNLGGIIVIDFIDMEDPEHQRQVLRTLEKACEQDPARSRFSGLSSLGLVEMSRKRTRESLAHQLCEPCAACKGRGRLKAPETMSYEIFRAILRDWRRRGRNHSDSRAGDAVVPGTAGQYLVRASQAVVDRLLDEDAANVESIASEVRAPIRFQVEPSYSNEHFDIVLMQDLRR
jgi:ribonuclease G